MVIIIKYLHLL